VPQSGGPRNFYPSSRGRELPRDERKEGSSSHQENGLEKKYVERGGLSFNPKSKAFGGKAITQGRALPLRKKAPTHLDKLANYRKKSLNSERKG